MSDWQTYRLDDFIPFTPEIYFRLLERINETFWPLPILTVTLGIAILVLALRGFKRTVLVLLAAAWLSSGIIFQLIYYAELNWAAPWFGLAFIVQAVVLLVIAAFIGRDKPPDESLEKAHKAQRASSWIGSTIAVGAVLAYPLLAISLGQGASHAEVFGLHADPTAIATLGLILIALRGPGAWLAILIPALWCLTTTLTLTALEAAWAWYPATIAAIAIVLLALNRVSLGRRRSA